MRLYLSKFLYITLLLVSLKGLQADSTVNPIIGILTIPSEYPDLYPPSKYSYFAQSYVTYLEAAGARVVPIQFDISPQNLTILLNKLNGVLFTGGDTNIYDKNGNLNQFGKTMSAIVDYVFQVNRNGTYFPLWGTCLGFQMIATLVSQKKDILVTVSGGYNISKPIFYYPNAYNTRILSSMPTQQQLDSQRYNLSAFYHAGTVLLSDWSSNPYLAGNFTPVAFTLDNSGKPYVCLIESKQYPIYGSQFHPEKNHLEWRLYRNTNHTYNAVQLSQYFANFFVNETRKNNRTFPDLQKYIIYNYNAVPVAESSFNAIYIFKNLNYTSSCDDEVGQPELLYY